MNPYQESEKTLKPSALDMLFENLEAIETKKQNTSNILKPYALSKYEEFREMTPIKTKTTVFMLIAMCLNPFYHEPILQKTYILDLGDKKLALSEALKSCKEEDIPKIARAIIVQNDKQNGFWYEAMHTYLCALIAFVSQSPKWSEKPYGQIASIVGNETYLPDIDSILDLTKKANKKYHPN